MEDAAIARHDAVVIVSGQDGPWRVAARVLRAGPALMGRRPMALAGRAREGGEMRGFMKVPVDAQTERIPGALMLCLDGNEIVHSLLHVMAAGASYRVVQRAKHIHPTVSEMIATRLGQLAPLAP